MGAPSPADLSTRIPGGIKLKDGYQSLIVFEDNPTLKLWEVESTPPGLDGGDPIDLTSQHNSQVHTKAPQSLIDCSDAAITCQYDPDVYDECLSLINVNQVITQGFADGSTLAFWGYLRSFTPNSLQRGQAPTAQVVIVVTNTDDDGAEQIPVMTEVSGS